MPSSPPSPAGRHPGHRAELASSCPSPRRPGVIVPSSREDTSRSPLGQRRQAPRGLEALGRRVRHHLHRALRGRQRGRRRQARRTRRPRRRTSRRWAAVLAASPPVRPCTVARRAPRRHQQRGRGQHGRHHARRCTIGIPSTRRFHPCSYGSEYRQRAQHRSLQRLPDYCSYTAAPPRVPHDRRVFCAQSQDPSARGSPAISARSCAVSPSSAAPAFSAAHRSRFVARHRHHVRALRQHPRQRHLRRSRPVPVPRGDPPQPRHHRLVRRHHLGGEPRMPGP